MEENPSFSENLLSSPTSRFVDERQREREREPVVDRASLRAQQQSGERTLWQEYFRFANGELENICFTTKGKKISPSQLLYNYK